MPNAIFLSTKNCVFIREPQQIQNISSLVFKLPLVFHVCTKYMIKTLGKHTVQNQHKQSFFACSTYTRIRRFAHMEKESERVADSFRSFVVCESMWLWMMRHDAALDESRVFFFSFRYIRDIGGFACIKYMYMKEKQATYIFRGYSHSDPSR